MVTRKARVVWETDGECRDMPQRWHEKFLFEGLGKTVRVPDGQTRLCCRQLQRPTGRVYVCGRSQTPPRRDRRLGVR